MGYEFVITGEDTFKSTQMILCPIEILVLRDALQEYVLNADIHILDRKVAEHMIELMWEEEEKLK